MNLLLGTLRTLLAHNSSGLSLRCCSGRLCLLGLLRALCSVTLVLSFLDGGETGGGSGFWSLSSALLDDIEGGSNDGSLGFDGTAGSLLGYFLLEGESAVSYAFSIALPVPSATAFTEL